jgi:hypothetical protein
MASRFRVGCCALGQCAELFHEGVRERITVRSRLNSNALDIQPSETISLVGLRSIPESARVTVVALEVHRCCEQRTTVWQTGTVDLEGELVGVLP